MKKLSIHIEFEPPELERVSEHFEVMLVDVVEGEDLIIVQEGEVLGQQLLPGDRLLVPVLVLPPAVREHCVINPRRQIMVYVNKHQEV